MRRVTGSRDNFLNALLTCVKLEKKKSVYGGARLTSLLVEHLEEPNKREKIVQQKNNSHTHTIRCTANKHRHSVNLPTITSRRKAW